MASSMYFAIEPFSNGNDRVVEDRRVVYSMVNSSFQNIFY